MILGKSMPSKEFLDTILYYNEESGKFLWKKKETRINIGDEAGSVDKTNGYIILRINSVNYKAHRIAWIIKYGSIPNNLRIDHIDGNKMNNRIDNLRLGTQRQNSWNRKEHRLGRLYPCIWKCSKTGKYSARVQINGVNIAGIYRATIEEAIIDRNNLINQNI